MIDRTLSSHYESPSPRLHARATIQVQRLELPAHVRCTLQEQAHLKYGDGVSSAAQ